MSLVVIDPSPGIAQAAQSLDEPLILLPQHGARIDNLLQKNVVEIITVDIDDTAQLFDLARNVLGRSKPKAVVSVTERGLEPAALLSDFLGTPGTPLRVVQALRNKHIMRQRLAERAPELGVEFADLRDLEGVRRLFSAHDRVVLKPATGTASVGVRLLRSIDELALAPRSGDWLVEAFLDGPEYSVETFSRHGRHQVVAIVLQEKSPWNSFVEVSHVMPSPGLSQDEATAIGRVVSATLDALELRDGPSHTEVKVSGGRVSVVETHNRPAGDGIAGLVEATLGIDWKRASIGWPLGARPEPGQASSPAAAITFFTARPGCVEEVRTPELTFDGAVVEGWGIDVKVGDRVAELRSSKDRVGWARVVGRSPESCLRAVRALQASPLVLTK